MNCTISETRKFDLNINLNEKDLRLIPYIVFALFALLSTLHFSFAVINFIICAFFIIKSKKSESVPFLIFITFFASIFKILELTEISLYTLLLPIFVVKEAILGRFQLRFLVALAILAVFILGIQVSSGTINISRNIKFFEFFFYVYIVIDAYLDPDLKLECESILKAVIFGVIVSSLFRFLDGNIFQISRFVDETISTYDKSSAFVRFSGLLRDPNYYAVSVHLAIISALFLGYSKKISHLYMIFLLVILVTLAVLTGSKSAIFMLIFPFGLLLFINFKQKRNIGNILFIAGVAIGLILVLSGRIKFLNYFVSRFKTNDFSLDALTTGRTAIWRDYFSYFKSNVSKLFIGTGVSALPVHGKAAHNTYIDILYHLGIIPGLVFAYLIVMYFLHKKVVFKRSIMNFSGIIIVLIMYLFLSSLFDIDLGTNVIVCVVIFNTCIDSGGIKNEHQESNLQDIRD